MFCCTKCGECCRHVKETGLLAELDRGDGCCRYLTGNLCAIYETRPLLCRVDEAYEKLFKPVMSRDTYDRLNAEQCQKLIGNRSCQKKKNGKKKKTA